MMNLLEQLVNSEQNNISEISNVSNIEINFIPKLENKYIDAVDLQKFEIILLLDGIKIHSFLGNRLFIHQIGKPCLELMLKKKYNSHILYFNDHEDEFRRILTDFHYNFNEARESLLNHCKVILKNIRIRYFYSESFKKHVAYGFISSVFQDSNQIFFRNSLIESLKNSGFYNSNHSAFQAMKYEKFGPEIHKPIKEDFESPQFSNYVSLKFSVKYGLNNGYRSYSVYFSRMIIMSNLILTPISSKQLNNLILDIVSKGIVKNYLHLFDEKNNYRFNFSDRFAKIDEKELVSATNWRNNSSGRFDKSLQEDMEYFVQRVTLKVVIYIAFFDERINQVKNEYYDDNSLNSFFELIKIARASKERILDKLKEKEDLFGRNILALSEALRDVGTFEKALTLNTKRFLIEIGSNLIDQEKYFKNVIANKTILTLTGDYSFVDR